jgi:hypothetical protein
MFRLVLSGIKPTLRLKASHDTPHNQALNPCHVQTRAHPTVASVIVETSFKRLAAPGWFWVGFRRRGTRARRGSVVTRGRKLDGCRRPCFGFDDDLTFSLSLDPEGGDALDDGEDKLDRRQ